MVRKNLQIILLLSSLIWLGSCDDSVVEPNKGGDPSDLGVAIVTPTGDEAYLDGDSDYIFDQEKVHRFDLILPKENLAFLDNDPTKEEYTEAMLVFEGDTISPVGLRYKGSIGAFVGCVSGANWADPSGRKTCTKLSMKVKINWGEREDHFYGLKKLQFHSMNQDDSHLHDRLAYHLFRAMDVPGPRCVHSSVYVNGAFVGIFAVVEQIDNRMIKYNFENDGGNVYKEIWPVSDKNLPYAEGHYIEGLKTNEDTPSAQKMRSFGAAIAGSSEASIKDVVSAWMDVDKTMSYCVVDRTIRADDGPFHWYCDGSSCTNHNYYWYEEPDNNRMYILPWDMDHAFENIISDQNPVVPIADDWGEISDNCQPFRYGPFGITQKSAACDQLTLGWVLHEEEFHAKKAMFQNTYLIDEYIDPLLSKWQEQMRPFIMQAQETHSDAISVSRWESAVTALKGQIKYAREN